MNDGRVKYLNSDEPLTTKDIENLSPDTKRFISNYDNVVSMFLQDSHIVISIMNKGLYAIRTWEFRELLSCFIAQLSNEIKCDSDEILKKLMKNAPKDADIIKELFKATVSLSPLNMIYLNNLCKARINGDIDWDSFKGLLACLSQLDGNQAEFLKTNIICKEGVSASHGARIYDLIQLGLVALNVNHSKYHFTEVAKDLDKYALSYPIKREYTEYQAEINGGTF